MDGCRRIEQVADCPTVRKTTLFAWRRILRDRDEEWAGPSRLHRQRLGEAGLGEYRDPQPLEPVGPALPVGAADRTLERSRRHPLPLTPQDLRAAALDGRLVAVPRGQVRERRAGPGAL